MDGQLITCRVLRAYRRDGLEGVDEIPQGEVVRVDAEELAQDRARRHRHLLTLEEEAQQRQEAEQRRQAEMAGADPTWRFSDRTAEVLLGQMQEQHWSADSFESAWESMTGYSLVPS